MKSRNKRAVRRGKIPAEERKPLTELQLRRYAAMRAAYGGRGIDQTDIMEALKDRGVSISRATVGAVILDTFRNPDVEKEFCRMTGTSRGELFPDKPDTPTTPPWPPRVGWAEAEVRQWGVKDAASGTHGLAARLAAIPEETRTPLETAYLEAYAAAKSTCGEAGAQRSRAFFQHEKEPRPVHVLSPEDRRRFREANADGLERAKLRIRQSFAKLAALFGELDRHIN